MNSFNKVILLGNLVRDPELTHTPAGAAMCKFTLALNNKYTSNGQTKEDVSYVDIMAWNKQADTLSQYMKKGNAIIVEGRLQQQRWETPEGQKRSRVEVVVQSFTFLPRGKKEQSGDSFGLPDHTYGGQPAQSDSNQPVNLNDVPF